MDRCLVDTDVLIWYLRGQSETVNLVNGIAGNHELAISVISRTEILVDMKEKEKQQTETLVNGLVSYQITTEIADLAASLIKKWRKKGKTVTIPDALIAATVIAKDIYFLTYNQKHFPMLKNRFYQIGS
jgi:hypothetical protein